MRVLFLTHRLPYAPNRGDRARAFNILKALRAHAEVDLVSLVHSPEEASHGEQLRGLVTNLEMCPVPWLPNRIRGAIHLGSQKALTHLLLDSPAMTAALERRIREQSPDVVLAFCSSMARFAVEPPLATLPLVIDLVDVDSLKWRDLAHRSQFPMSSIYAREARLLSAFEAKIAEQAHAITVVTQREATALRDLAPGANVIVSPIGIEPSRLIPEGEASSSSDVVFCGVMDYAPNVEAAEWLAKRVWPLVLARVQFARLKIVGADPSRQVRALASAESRVDVTGTVPDVRPYLWESAVAVAPLHTARGTQTKVLEAVAAGLPCVVTQIVADGLPLDILPACSIAESPEQFADAVVGLLRREPEARRAIARRATLQSLTWETGLAPLIGALRSASLGPSI